MIKSTKKLFRTAAIPAAIIILAIGGFNGLQAITAYASSSSREISPSYYAEDGAQDDENEDEGNQGEGGQDDTSSVTSNEGGQQDSAALLQQYSARLKDALDELESHARAMIVAGNAGNRKKYDSEQKAFEDAEKKVSSAINAFEGLPWDDAAPITDKAYDRLYSIEKLREQAETALANSLGGAMDEDGNIYSIKKVSATISQVGKTDDMYYPALQGLGPSYKEDEKHLVYKISLFVGKKPVHLIGGLTKSVTIGIPGELIGRSPVTSYYLWDEGDGNQGAPIGEKRGYFDTSSWCLTVKVSKYVTYYVVCGKPGSKGEIYGDDIVAVMGKNQQLTVDELSKMISIVFLDDGNEKKARVLEAVDTKGKSTAVVEISLPEEIMLLPDAEAVAEVVCPETAKKTVEIYKLTDENEPEWIGTYLADNEGKLQIATDSFGLFVLSWQDEPEEEVPAIVTPTDTVTEKHSFPTGMLIIGILASLSIIGGAAILIIRYVKK